MDEKFIEERRKHLEYFMQKMKTLKFLWYSEEFKVFLRSLNPDIEKALEKLPKQTYEELIHKYEQKFSVLSGKEINNELVAKINSFVIFLKKIGPMFENFKKMIKNMIEARKGYSEKFIQL